MTEVPTLKSPVNWFAKWTIFYMIRTFVIVKYSKTYLTETIQHMRTVNFNIYWLSWNFVLKVIRRLFWVRSSEKWGKYNNGTHSRIDIVGNSWNKILKLFVILYLLVFYKQPAYKQLALGWQIAKQLSGLSLLSLSNNKH